MKTKDAMTYGTLPSRAIFEADFAVECPDGYRVALNASDSRTLDRSGSTADSHGTWDVRQAWNAVTCLRDLWEMGDDDAGNLASAILDTLGYEWI